MLKLCTCWCNLSYSQSIKGLFDEVVEFIKEPSRDELSDICVMVNRFIGSMLGRVYVRLLHYDQLYFTKVNYRLYRTGCIRSRPVCKLM